MVNVTNNYKLIDLEINGEQMTVQINTPDAWNVFEFVVNHTTTAVNEGDMISFVVESSAELKTGLVVKITGKSEKTKIKIIPTGQDCEEIWGVISIKDDSLQVINN